MISSRQVHVWHFHLNRNPTDKEIASLNDEERARAARYHFEHHRRRFMVGRITLRQILSEYLNTSPQSIKFNTLEYGKPFLSYPNSTLQFNLSHSDEQALLAIGDTHPVGIDIECFSARPYEGIGQHVFSPQENKILKELPAMLKPLFFFNVWAQKEAYIKAIGEGLRYPVDKFTAPDKKLFIDPIYKKSWQMKTFMPSLATSAALCCHPEIDIIQFKNYLHNKKNHV